MEPELIAIELRYIEAAIAKLAADFQSMIHGLGYVEQQLQFLAELPGQWEDEKNVGNQGI